MQVVHLQLSFAAVTHLETRVYSFSSVKFLRFEKQLCTKLPRPFVQSNWTPIASRNEETLVLHIRQGGGISPLEKCFSNMVIERRVLSGWLRELFGHRRRRRERGQRSSVVLLHVSLHALPNCFYVEKLVRAFSAFFWAPFDGEIDTNCTRLSS